MSNRVRKTFLFTDVDNMNGLLFIQTENNLLTKIETHNNVAKINMYVVSYAFVFYSYYTLSNKISALRFSCTA